MKKINILLTSVFFAAVFTVNSPMSFACSEGDAACSEACKNGEKCEGMKDGAHHKGAMSTGKQKGMKEHHMASFTVDGNKAHVEIMGMSCKACEDKVTESLKKSFGDGIANIAWVKKDKKPHALDLELKAMPADFNVKIKAAIEDAGFTMVDSKEVAAPTKKI